jgi:ATP-dependent RNA helicase RhlB
MTLENNDLGEDESGELTLLEKIKKAEELVPTAATFEEAGVSPDVVAAIKKSGWNAPTPVQGMCLPLTIQGRDVAGFAQTGTGKTGVFVITVAERLYGKAPPERLKIDVAVPEVLVLTPTRELTMQIDDDAQNVIGPLNIKSVPVFGGVDVEKQAAAFRDGPRMIVATPGRLKDFYQRKMVDLSQVKIFICDEADRMFDMGFIDDVEFFLDKIPENAQKLLFSATTNDNVKELAFEYLNQPAYVSVNPEVLTPELIDQHAVICDSSNKLRVMLGLLREHAPVCSIIFTNTKMTAEWLHFKLNGNGIDADLITGDLPQKKRIELIQRIKEGKVKALIATDVASRGLHISKVTHVYNFDVSDDPSNYVHRIGRTARAGARGSSYTLVCEDYGENIRGVQDMLGNQTVLKGEWFNPEYLKIKDLAGNPYAVGAALYRDPKDRADRKGAFGRDDRDGRGKFGGKDTGDRKSPQAFDRPSDRPASFRGGEKTGGPGAGRDKFTDPSKGQDRVPRSSERPRHDARPAANQGGKASHSAPRQASAPVVIRAEGTPIGLVGWIVKISKGIFGMK